MMKVILWIICGILLLFILGPTVQYEPVTLFETSLQKKGADLEQYVDSLENSIPDLKPGNASKIYWVDDALKGKTKFVVLYLHGFSASPEEGKEFALMFGSKYGFNVYMPRLEDHGRRDTNSFELLTPDNYLQSAEDAVDVAQNLGDSIILISCSTGSTLGLILASHGEKIHSHFMYSPNIDIFDKKSSLLLFPWGKHMSKFVMKGEHNRLQYSEEQKKYWNHVYHMNGVFTVKFLIKKYMNETYFKYIKHPVFLGYYFKDVNHQDSVVSVQKMLDMIGRIKTPVSQKRAVAFPEAGTHLIISPLFSKQMEEIQRQSFLFAEEVLGLVPVKMN